MIELGIILAVLLGWRFTLAELVGGPIMIAILMVLFRLFLKPEMVEVARERTDEGVAGVMEGHAEMDMSVTEGSLLTRLTSARGFTAISHYCAMDWVSIWKDIGAGLLIAGALAAWMPESFWQSFLLVEQPLLSKIWAPLVGPTSRCCLLVTFYVSMVLAGIVVEVLSQTLGLVSDERDAEVVEASVTWKGTTILNIVFLALSAILVVRFLRAGSRGGCCAR